MNPTRRRFFETLTMLACALWLTWSGEAHAQYPDEDSAKAAPANTSEPSAEELEKASEHFKRGVQFYRERDFRNALIEFKRAHEIAPNYRVLFNLGQTSFELKDYVEAKRAFTSYLEQGGAEIKPARRKEVEAELERLEGYVAHIALTVNVEGAEVAVDDIVVGTTPLPPILVSAGRRKVAVRKAGHAPLERLIDVAGGENKEVSLELTSLRVETVPTDPMPNAPTPGEEETSSAGFWVALSLTVASGAAAGVMGALALKAKSDYDDELGTFPNDAQSIDDASGKVGTFAALTDVFAALAIGGAATTIALGVYTFGGGDDEDETARVTVGIDGVYLRGSF